MLWQALICLPQLFQKFSSGLNVVHGTSTYFRTPILDEGSSICFVAYPPKLRDEPTLRCIIKVQDGKNWSKANSESRTAASREFEAVIQVTMRVV